MMTDNSTMRNCWRRIWTGMGCASARCLVVYMAVSAVIWTLQCTLLQNFLALDILETISWGAKWQWGHLKHPPLSGWLGYLCSLASGYHDWSIYLAAQLCNIIGVWYVVKFAALFFKDRVRPVLSGLLLYFLFYYTPSSMKFCSHFVEVALQPVMAYYFLLALEKRKLRHWAVFGLVSALAVLGKYSALMLLAALFVCMLIKKEHRIQILSAGPYLALAVFLAVLLPHLHWLVKHDFSCFGHLDYRMNEHARPWYFALETVAVALYPLLSSAAVLLAVMLPRHFRRVSPHRPALAWSLLLCGIPSGILLAIVFSGGNVVQMWFSFLCSWAGMAAVAASPFFISRRMFRRMFVFLIAATAVMFVATTADLLVKPRARLHIRPEEFTALVQRRWSDFSAAPVPCVIGERQLANAAEHYLSHRPVSADWEDRFSIDLLRGEAETRGLFLIAWDESTLREFLNLYLPGTPVEFHCDEIKFRTLSGKEKSKNIVTACLPPVRLLIPPAGASPSR